MRGKFTVRLASVGNPDYGQYTPVSDPGRFIGDSIEDCAEACAAYILRWNLGGGNWPETPVMRDGAVVGWICYNGRVQTPAEHARQETEIRNALAGRRIGGGK